MSLYNQLFGMNPLSVDLLRIIDVGGDEFPVARFRDAHFVEVKDDLRIAVFTRQGGGNRHCYGDEYDGDCGGPSGCSGCSNDQLKHHPLYVRDYDDDFDSTYATFEFRPPEAAIPFLRELMQTMGQKGASPPMEKFKGLINNLQAGVTAEQDPHVARSLNVAKDIFGRLEQAIWSKARAE